MHRYLISLTLALLASSPVRAQLTVRLTRVPPDTPADATIYVAGSFNRWDPGARDFALVRGADGTYAITLPDSVRGPVEFKFTRGSWASVETTDAGADVPNRAFVIPPAGAATLDATIGGWRSSAPREPAKRTASKSVRILGDSVAMPQLGGRTRRVWIYLPPDYATARRKRYPVIYMHDGQNVFDAATSFAGEWGVDETLDSLFALGTDPGAIVVAVDHGGTHRLDEYNPWKAVDPKYGGGEGRAYVEFLVRTLKPYVDARYRTRPGRRDTGIVGSSMGGLISLYAALAHPDVFGRAGVFSCACWVSRPDVMALARAAKPRSPAPRLYFVVGGEETPDDEPVADQDTIVRVLRAAGFPASALRARTVGEGKHTESFWRREFPVAYRWLFRE